jgi:hypothetical protein
LGRAIPDPARGDLLPTEGRWLPRNQYWLRRLAEGDVTETAAPFELPDVVVCTGRCGLSPEVALMVIDNWLSLSAHFLSVTHETNPSPADSQQPVSGAGIILGDYRQFYLHEANEPFDGASTVQAGIGPHLLVQNDPDTTVTVRINYDGMGLPIDPIAPMTTGLGAVDLTVGGATGFYLGLDYCDAGVDFAITVYSGIGENVLAAYCILVNPALVDVSIPTGVPYLFFPLADFIGDGVDWTAIGALQLRILGPAGYTVDSNIFRMSATP